MLQRDEATYPRLEGRPRLALGFLSEGFALALCSFISECGFGGIRNSAPMRRFVSANWSSLVMSDSNDRKGKEQDAAYSLVGEFMFHWSYIESKITLGIQNLLRLPAPQGEIVLANVTFRDKTSMLATLAYEILHKASEDAANKALKFINEITTFSGTYRNVLVHNPFIPRDDGTIEIFRVKAKGKFEIPETVWDKDFFEARFKEIDGFEVRLDRLLDALMAAPKPHNFVTDLLPFLGHGAPSGSFAPPILRDPQYHPLAEPQHSPPQASTEEEDQKNPQGPPLKDGA